MTRPVAVITGVGAVSAFGVGWPALRSGLTEGRSAIRPIRSFDASTFPVNVAGEVPMASVDTARLSDVVAPLFGAARLDDWRREGWLRDRKLAWAVLAAAEAWRQARCGDAERGAWLSLALGLEQAFLEDFDPLLQDGHIAWSRAALGPGVKIRSAVDLAGRAVTDLLGLEGPRAIHVSACAAGGLSLAHAASLISRGAAEIVLCGAADAMVNPLGLGGMARLGAPSPRNAPDACRPFDKRRDGLVMGEGAAIFVVEDAERARARGVAPLARISGWGSTQDAYRATAPRPDGARAAAAMRQALSCARLEVAGIGYINAHGTGTTLNDPAEIRAIRSALGPHAEHVAISSIKGAIGHLMAAAGALEAAASLLAFSDDLLPGTAHYEVRDPECDLDIIGPVPRAKRVDAVLSNSFGFGGQNVSVILERC